MSDIPDFNSEPVLTEDLYALVPHKLLPEARDTITMEELARLPLLLLNQATALRMLIEDTAKASNLTLRTRFEFNQAQTLISMACAGLGAAVLPSVVLPDQPLADTNQMLIVQPKMTCQVAIITLKGRTLSPAAGKLAQLAQLVRLLIGVPHSTRNRSKPFPQPDYF